MNSYVSRNLLPIAVLVALGWSTLLAAQEKRVPVVYDLKVNIEPAKGDISVRGKIEVPLQKPGARELQFALHDTFAVKELSVNGHKAGFSFRPAEFFPITPAQRNVIVNLPTDSAGDKLRLDIVYEGHLKELPEFGAVPFGQPAMDDQINARLVELAIYSVWYPRFFDISSPIKIDMELSLPSEWTAICSGEKVGESNGSGHAVTRWSSPKDIDIVITAAPNYKLKSQRVSNGNIEIYSTRLPDEFIKKETTQIADMMALFTERLGETTIPGGTVRQVYSPKRKGQGRAGIARPGLIVTSEGLVLEQLQNDPHFSLFQDVAHEVAHFWWHFGTGQGDWINEAFAEYFSAVAVQKIVSEEQFMAVLANYRNEVGDLPADAVPLAEVPFNGDVFVIRYYKGSLMLDSLRGLLGDEKFFAASREFFQRYKNQTIGTGEFRTFWREKLGSQQAVVNTWLDSRGGLPDLKRAQSAGAGTKR